MLLKSLRLKINSNLHRIVRKLQYKQIKIETSSNNNNKLKENNVKDTGIILKSINNKPQILKNIVKDSVLFVEQLMHLDEVRQSQEKVMRIKDELKESGDQKRQILYELNTLKLDMQKISTAIGKCDRNSEPDRYIGLFKQELELMRKEEAIQKEFSKADEVERRYFNSLTNAINESHEKEKLHSNMLRTLGIIGSLASFIISTIGYYLHNRKTDVFKHDIRIEDLHRQVKRLTEQLAKVNQNEREGWVPYIVRHTKRFGSYINPFK